MARGVGAAWLLVALATVAVLRASAAEPHKLPQPVRRSTSAKTVQTVAHLEDDGEPAPIAVAPEPPPEASSPPKVLSPAEAIQPAGEAWQGAVVESQLPPATDELTWRECLTRACLPHRDPNDSQRHIGLGEPLTNTSWRNRPLYVDFFAGGLIGDELQEGIVSQGGGFMAGGRFGGDFDHYWGLETRLAFSDVQTNFAAGGYGQSRDSFFDASLLYYPWGDSRWRPYVTVGLGVANYRYNLADGTKISASGMELPWGAGLKYLLQPNLALRFDLIDNLSFAGGSRSDTLHNVSFTGGIELRFGGRRTSYGSW
jgi:hypothetical protein